MQKPASAKSRIFPYAASTGLILAITILGELVKRRFEPTNLAMFYLLAVVITAIRWGRGPAVTASVLSVLAFDFFLVPPSFTFDVADIQYIFTFIALLTVGLVISTLASKTRRQIIQRQREKLQSALLNSVSHDLKTPLVSITGSLTALLEGYPAFDELTRKELLKTALEGSESLNRIVGNLLDMTRAEAGALNINRKPCELRDIVGASLETLKTKLGSRDVRIQIPPGFPEIPLDFSFMMKVFLNLIDNAIKYSPDGAAIEIAAESLGGQAKITVKDRGTGIRQEDLKHIFDKFYRAQQTREISGTGLGLSICKAIVEAHGGSIAARNNDDRGAVFIITLPLN